ncbi:MAG: rod shape-determining protein RodA [Saprospiraceae bacterium]|nr:rod shape-determining protein RodA [Saprospiraceae bacterium]
MAKRQTALAIDWILLTVFLSIILIGWLMLYTVSYVGPGFWFSFDSIVGRQTIWMGISAVAFIAIYTLDWRIWNTLAYPVYFLTTFLLAAVLVFGQEINGANSWFSVFGFSFQPSEIAKFGTALALSAYLSQGTVKMDSLKDILLSFTLFTVPAGLIILQPDPGTALVFMAFTVPLFRAGLNASLYLLGISLAFTLIGSLLWSPFILLLIILLVGYYILISNSKEKRIPFSVLALLTLFLVSSFSYVSYSILLTITIIAGIYFYFLVYKRGKYKILYTTAIISVLYTILAFGTKWSFENILKPHHQDRINVWLKPELTDPKGALYNIIQSKTAIGSGGLTGKGFLDGNMTKLNYVPEQSTDFIFSILGEEQGFLGSISLVLLFTLMLFRISIIAERSTLPFIRYYAYSIAGIIFIHFFINIGMTVGLMPVIGIPLPLMSKGGSSLLSFTIMIAALLKMDQSRVR